MPLNKLKQANSQIGGQGSSRTAQTGKGIDDVLGGGQAPAIMKDLGTHIKQASMLMGKKSLADVIGVGEVPLEGKAGPGVSVSVNLRDASQNRHVSAELKEFILDLKKEIHNAFIMQQIQARKTHMPVSVLDTPYFKANVAPKLKAFNLSDFAAWVPTLNTAFYFEELEVAPGIEQLFLHHPMSARTEQIPGALTRMKGRLEGDSATFSAQYNTSSSYTMTAQDCVAHTDITEDLMQDLVPAAGGFERLRREVALGIGRSKEDAILNGDDTIGTLVQGDGHMDSDVAGGAATLFNKAFKGLRKRALAAGLYHDNAGAGISLATYNALIALFGKFAMDKGDLALIYGPSIANKVICGNVPEILTHEKFNSNYTLQTGNLPPVFGIAPYISEWVREDVNNAGVYAAASSLTTLTLVKKSRFVVGVRAPMKIWATPSLASSDKLLLTAKERFTFGGVPQSASEKSVAIALNLALT